MEIWWLLPITIGLAGLIWLVWKLNRTPKLGKTAFFQARKQIQDTAKLDPNHALMDSHKAFINALQSLYPEKRTNGAALIKKVVTRLPNEKVIWKLHRTRNRAAHEPNFKVFGKTASQAQHEFERALKALR